MEKVENPSPKTLYMREWIRRHMVFCLDCGKPIYPYHKRCRSCAAKHGKEGKEQAYCIDCGRELARLYRAGHRCRACDTKFRRGGNASGWKGGRREDAQGYVLIYKPEHPRANSHRCVFEHILVWEESHGKPLPKGWIVHHLNGIKNDNRPKNLEGLPNKKHCLVLEAKARRIQELEALLENQSQLL